MAVRLYMDVHVQRAVTEQLRLRGIDVLTAQENAATTVDDESLLHRSTQLLRLLVTQDIRLEARAGRWINEGKRLSGLAFAHQQSITIGKFVQNLEFICKASLEGECENQIFHLPF